MILQYSTSIIIINVALCCWLQATLSAVRQIFDGLDTNCSEFKWTGKLFLMDDWYLHWSVAESVQI